MSASDPLFDDVRAWIAGGGWPPLAGFEPLVGGASDRIYLRVRFADGATRVVMVRPVSAVASEHGASVAGADQAFEAIGAWLEAGGVRVPCIEARSADGRFLVLEDLGGTRLFDVVASATPSERVAWYRRAVNSLVAFQRHAWASKPPAVVSTRRLGRGAVLAELNEFRDMGLVARHDLTLTPSEREVIERAWVQLADELASLDQNVAHRDFQSQNLMVVDNDLAVIDFQDAFLAPWTYDLVALLRDSYVELPLVEVELLLDHYWLALKGLPGPAGIARDDLRRAFHLQTVQRKLKDSGRFETLERRGKKGFLKFYPASMRYVASALDRVDGYDDLLDVLTRYVPEVSQEQAQA